MALRLSPFARISVGTIPRQLAPTVGPAHGGFEFLKGSFEGLKGYAVGRLTKSHRDKIYIDDEGWGSDAGSIEYGYRVPFGGIHVFIGKIGEPDLCADLIETAQCARPARGRPALRHAFVGCIHGDETAAGSDGESSTDESNSLYQLQDGRLRGCSDGDGIPDPFEPPSRVGIFMAGAQPVQNPAAGSGNPVPSPAQTASRPQMSQTRCINFKMVGPWVVPMVTVFRIRLSRRAGLESSWPVRSLFRTLLLGQETRCLRRLRC